MEAQEGGLGVGQEGQDRGHVPMHAAQGGDVHERARVSSSSLSVAKHKAPGTKRQKPPTAKQLSSPVVTMVRSPSVRLMMSPRLLSSLASRARSPSVPQGFLKIDRWSRYGGLEVGSFLNSFWGERWGNLGGLGESHWAKSGLSRLLNSFWGERWGKFGCTW